VQHQVPSFESLGASPKPENLLQRIGVHEIQHTVLCNECGWVFKPLVLTPDQNKELYSLVGGANTYDTSSHWQTRRRARGIFNRIVAYQGRSSKAMRVLDVGGGVGQASFAFAENGNEVHILDIATGATLHPRIVVHSSSLEAFHTDAQYSVAVVAHVLEHLWSPSTAAAGPALRLSAHSEDCTSRMTCCR
jgi:hypothetical protein